MTHVFIFIHIIYLDGDGLGYNVKVERARVKTEKKSKTIESKASATGWKKYIPVAVLTGIVILPVIIFVCFFWNKVYFNVFFGEVNLSRKNYEETKSIIEKGSLIQLGELVDIYGDKKYSYSFSELGLTINQDKTAQAALSTFRNKDLVTNIISMIGAIRSPFQLEPAVEWNEAVFEGVVNDIGNKSTMTKTKPAEYKAENGKVKVMDSVNGFSIDREDLKKQIVSNLNHKTEVKLLTVTDVPDFDSLVANESIAKAQEIADSDISFKYDLNTYKLTGEELVGWLEIYKNPDSSFSLKLRDERYKEFFEKISKVTDREVKNPILKIEGKRVTEFVPPIDGRKMDTEESLAKALQAITGEVKKGSTVSIDLVVKVTKPENFENNQYGIRELVSRGVSDFSGSIPGRIYNIKLAASRINGSLIAPGEEFSFNSNLGDISSATGYQSAYVIENGRTVLGDGGGVCQVSTTAFRAALNAGLEITARSAHAYRVGYYEKLGFKPGLDAAIYQPSLDLKFKNNTPKYILISAYTNGTRLTFDFYGTSDNREVKISEPIVSNTRPAPEPRYQDDPSLNRGVTKQVDFAATGATSKFTQTVTLNNQVIINKTFTSVYRPWQAVYLVGTKD